MITKYGMSEKLGPVVYGKSDEEVFLGRDFGTQKNYSEKIASVIDEEIDLIIKTQYDKAKSILSENMDKLHTVAKYLFDNEKMNSEQFDDMMKGNLIEEE